MKKFKIKFWHTDNNEREVVIEAFDLDRAKVRFEVNWGYGMKILEISKF